MYIHLTAEDDLKLVFLAGPKCKRISKRKGPTAIMFCKRKDLMQTCLNVLNIMLLRRTYYFGVLSYYLQSIQNTN